MRSGHLRRRGATASTTMALAAGGLLLVGIGFSLGLLAGRGMAEPVSEPPGSPVTAAPVQNLPEDTARAVAPASETRSDATLDAPPIELDPPVLDFGQIPPGAPVTGTVHIRNVGRHTLRIVQSRPSCKCTAVSLADVIIPPGESVPMVASLDPGYTIGPKKAAVRVLFEGGFDVVQIEIVAEITMAVRASPAYIDAADGTTLSGSLAVEATDGRTFRVLAVDGRPPAFVGYDPAQDEPRASYELAWDLSMYDPSSCVDADGNSMPVYWPIETDHPECGVLDVQVRHPCTRRKLPPAPQSWVVSERRVLAGTLREGEPFEFELRMLKLPRRTPADTTVERVESESPDFTAELVGVRRSADDVIFTIRVTPAPGHRGLIHGTARVYGERYSDSVLIIGRVAG